MLKPVVVLNWRFNDITISKLVFHIKNHLFHCQIYNDFCFMQIDIVVFLYFFCVNGFSYYLL